jgi:hypothetical protein
MIVLPIELTPLLEVYIEGGHGDHLISDFSFGFTIQSMLKSPHGFRKIFCSNVGLERSDHWFPGMDSVVQGSCHLCSAALDVTNLVRFATVVLAFFLSNSLKTCQKSEVG